MGFLAELSAIIALIYLWGRSSPKLWWLILGLLVAQRVLKHVVRASLHSYGMRDKVSIFWGAVCGFLQLSLIVASAVAFFK